MNRNRTLVPPVTPRHRLYVRRLLLRDFETEQPVDTDRGRVGWSPTSGPRLLVGTSSRTVDEYWVGSMTVDPYAEVRRCLSLFFDGHT